MIFALLACTTVTPGTVILEVEVCGDAGKTTVHRSGWITYGPCVDLYTLPTRELRQVWTKASTEGTPIDESITFAGKDGQKINVDVSIGYQLEAEDVKILTMVQTFGYDLEGTIHTRVRDSVRNNLNMCASTMSVEEIYGPGKDSLFVCATEKLQTEFNPKGLLITRLTLNSEVRLPEQVQKAMEGATAANQLAEKTRREVESTRAEGEKTVAKAEAEANARIATATAEAEANRLLSESISPSLIRLKELEIEKIKAEKWNGALPMVQGGGNTTMLMDVGTIGAVAK